MLTSFLLIAWLSASVAQARKPPQAQKASQPTEAEVLNTTGEDAAKLQLCSVYFLVVSSCTADQRPDLARTYRDAAEKIIGLAIAGRRVAGVSDEAYAAQTSLETEAMMKSMSGNCANIAVLRQKYSKFCQRLSQDADPRLKQWIACIHTKRSMCRAGP